MKQSTLKSVPIFLYKFHTTVVHFYVMVWIKPADKYKARFYSVCEVDTKSTTTFFKEEVKILLYAPKVWGPPENSLCWS